MAIKLATGPQVSKVSKEEAEAAFRRNPDFPKNADEYVLEELDGHWVAAVHVADNPFGGPADQSEESPGPKSEGPGDTAPDDGDEPPEDGADDGGKPPFGKDDEKGEGKEHEKGEEHQLTAIHDAIQKILVALGIPDGEAPGESPVPGEEPPAGPPGPPAGGPPGPDQQVEHTKALKPGEVPPGAQPVGAPAFSHITPHPWEPMIGTMASFTVEERVPMEYTAADVDAELREVAHGTGFKVKQVETHINEHGHKIGRALISAY